MATSAPYNVANGSNGPGQTFVLLNVGSGTGSPTGTAAGDLVYVLTSDGLAEAPSSVVDSQGNTYAAVVTGSTGQQRCHLWASLTTTALVAGTDLINVSWPSSTGNKIAIACGASGIASATADKSNSNSGTSAAPTSNATGALSQASELVVGGIKYAAGGIPLTAPSFGSALTVTLSAALSEFHVVTTTTGTRTASATLNASVLYGALIGTFEISLPSITTASLPSATSGSAYSQALSVSGGLPAYTWSITSGSLTGSGLTLSSAGVISGTAAGGTASYTCTYQVSDGNGNTNSKSLTLNVVAGGGGGGFANVQNGTAQSGTGSVAVTLPVASTAGNLLVAVVEAAATGPFTGPAGWTQAAFTGGGSPVLLGERNVTFDQVTGAGVTGLTTAISYVGAVQNLGGAITEGIPAHWPSGTRTDGIKIWWPDVGIQIFDYAPVLTDTVTGALDSNHSNLMTTAPAGSWIMPWHEPNVNSGTAGTQDPAMTKSADIYLIALKNRVAPSLLYGRGIAAGASTAAVDISYLDTGYAYTSTNASPAVFTVSSGNPGGGGAFNFPGASSTNGCPVILKASGLPTGFTANRVYYIVNQSGNTFQLSATIGGTGVNATSTGSGTIVPVMDFYGMDGYQHDNQAIAPDDRFGPFYAAVVAAYPGAQLAIIETGTAVGTNTTSGGGDPPPLTGVTRWLGASTWTYNGTTYGPGLLGWAQTHPNLFSVNTYYEIAGGTPGNTKSPGSQLWQNQFAAPMQALSNGLAALGAGSSTNDIEIWYRANAPATSTATFTGPGGVLCRGAMAEFSSPAGTSQALDTAPVTAGGTTPATSLPVKLTATAGDLGVVAFGNWFTSSPGGTWTSPAGYSRVSAFAGAGTSLFDFEYKTGLAGGSQTVTGVYSSSANQASWGAVAATFTQVFSAPVITTSSLSGGTAGASYTSTAMAATGGVSPYTWSAGTGKPPGVLLSSAGAWSGTPTAPGSYTFTITATDQNGATGSKTFTVVIAAAVQVTTTTLPGGVVSTPYTAPALAVSGGTAPFTWAVTGGTLPAGVALSAGGAWSGTPTTAATYSFTVAVTDANGSTDPQALSIVIAPTGTPPPPPAPSSFPGSPLGVKVELQVNGTWNDITHYVLVRDSIVITGGSSQEGSTPSPATCTMTLNNRDGRFSPGTSGALAAWGGNYLLRNVLLRVSVTATSSTGVAYSGYRFWGSVATWPPASDVSGHDVYVAITASGPLRQITQGGGKGGALTRYYHSLDGTPYAPAAYWPCEEDTSTFFIDSGVYAGQPMTITGTPLWKGNSSFNGTSPMPVVNKSTWDGITGSFNSSGDDVYTIPGTYTWVASTNTVQVICQGGGGGGGGGLAGNGSAGGATIFPGDLVTVTANGGGATSGNTGGAGGSGSGNSVEHHGGAGANATGGNSGGGGGSAGSAANGNPGSGTTGGAAVTDGGKGGNGGIQGIPPSAPQAGSAPGGGGGGSAFPIGPGGGGGEYASEPSVAVTPGRAYQVTVGAGGQGASASAAGGGGGVAELKYTPATKNIPPPANVVRFLAQTPLWGIPATAVLLRFFTAVTVANSNLTHFDVVQVAAGLQLKGYTGAGLGSLNFTSATLNIPAGQPVMVSVELANNNAGGVTCTMKAIVAGAAALLGSVTKIVTSSVIDNITEVIVGPNADVTKTAVGHITVQYALVPLTAVSDAVNGHYGEMGVDRFIRLCGEQALGNAVQFAETKDHWGFEGGVQSWASGGNCGIATSSFTVTDPAGINSWPAQGAQSLLATSTATGAFSVISPFAVGQAQTVQPGDVVTAGADIYAPAALAAAYMGIKFFTANGTAISETDSAAVAVAAGSVITLKAKAIAPTSPAAAFFNLHVGNSDAASPAGTQMYVDNVRVSPRMGTQTRADYRDYLEQVKDLEQGILKEARDLYGLKYKTRIAVINNPVAVTLDYNAQQIAPGLAPVQDDKLTVTQVTVKRTEGSRVTVSQSAGQLTTSLPAPFGGGRVANFFAKQAKVAAEDDAQLIALATHLLNLGTDTSTRYPVITANLANSRLGPIFAAAAQAEIGDRVQLVNLPFWLPEATADQMIIGYVETLGPKTWTIDWNCQPFSPWGLEITNTRRW